MSRPTLRTCAMLVVLAAGLLAAMKVAADAVAAGAPGWLNLFVLVLAWDAIKIGAATVLQFSRWAARAGKQAFWSNECSTAFRS